MARGWRASSLTVAAHRQALRTIARHADHSVVACAPIYTLGQPEAGPRSRLRSFRRARRSERSGSYALMGMVTLARFGAPRWRDGFRSFASESAAWGAMSPRCV